ncbi:prohibitin family protein [Okeania sp. SIO1F9]|uniref:prohibitin family protein n=1 Tax=Okeania sp. SIO1F9 TaxID=2607813 RepID=UPI0025798FE0|nr:prohibitin family protein [Okeania sp. SIO1F9]
MNKPPRQKFPPPRTLNTSKSMLNVENPIKIGIAALLGLFGIVMLRSTFLILQPGEAGVLQVLGSVREGEPMREGLHIILPFVSKVNKYDIRVQKHQINGLTAASKDLQDITAEVVVNYQVQPSELVNILRDVGTFDNVKEKYVEPQAQEAFKIASAKLKAEESVTKREELMETFNGSIIERLQKFGIRVVATALVDVDFSPEFSKSVEEKQIAEQKAQKAKYIAQEAEQEAQAMINRAKGKAEANRLEAESLKAQGSELVIQKLFLESWDGKLPLVMSGNEDTLLLDMNKLVDSDKR